MQNKMTTFVSALSPCVSMQNKNRRYQGFQTPIIFCTISSLCHGKKTKTLNNKGYLVEYGLY
jgi:hypothetical protein